MRCTFLGSVMSMMSTSSAFSASTITA
jgi:hypothetical protein